MSLFGGFNNNNNQQQQQQQQMNNQGGLFGQPISQGLFGITNTNVGGSTLFGSGGLFGNQPQQQQQQMNNQGGLFGSLGSNNTGLFGQGNVGQRNVGQGNVGQGNVGQGSALAPPSSMFDQNTNQSSLSNPFVNNSNSIFGQNTNSYSLQSTPTFNQPSSSIFGQGNNYSNSSFQNQGISQQTSSGRGTDIKWLPLTAQGESFTSLTALQQFSSYSFEELRALDYKENQRKPKTTPNSFCMTTPQQQQQGMGGLFCSQPSNTNTSGFGSNLTFGQQQSSGLFGGLNNGNNFIGNQGMNSQLGIQSQNNNNQNINQLTCGIGGLSGNSTLFGNNTNNNININNGGGLFGNFSSCNTNNNNNNSSGRGLLSQQQPVQNQSNIFGTPQSNLFGNNQQQTGSFLQNPAPQSVGLFGQPSSGGLFGPSSNGGLFGPSSSSGLFNNPQSTTTSGGLFGNPQQGTRSPFDLSNQSTNIFPLQSTGGLFNQSNQLTTQSCGLFSQQSSTPSSTLFGHPPQSASQSTSLSFFNNPQQSTSTLFGQPIQSTTSSSSLFGPRTTTSQSTDLFGQSLSTGLFGQPQPSTTLNKPVSAQQSLFDLSRPSTLFSGPLLQESSFENKRSNLPTDPINKYIFEMDESKTIDKLLDDFQKKYETNCKYEDAKIQRRDHNLVYNTVINHQEFKDFLKSKRTFESVKKTDYTTDKRMLSEKKNQKIFDPIKTDHFLFTKPNDPLTMKAKSHSCDISKTEEKIIMTNLASSFDQTMLFDEPISNRKSSDISIFINLRIQIVEPYRLVFNMKISKNAQFKVLKTTIANTLKEKHPKYKHLTFNSFILLRKYTIVKETPLIAESDLCEGDTLFVILKESIPKGDGEGKVCEVKRDSQKKKSIKKNDLAPLEKLPQLTKQGYKTVPDMKTIYRMSSDDLELVKNFEIFNEHGKIAFEEPCDLTAMNLDQIVSIEPGNIRMYSNDNGIDLLSPGNGLNKKAVIIMYNIKNPDDIEYDGIIPEELTYDYQKKKCEEMKGKFKRYDNIKEEFVFVVPHF